MKYILIILLSGFGHLCFGQAPNIEDKKSDLFLGAVQILCDSGEEASLCEPVAKLNEAISQHDLALNSKEREEKIEQLEDSYKSEVDPYIESFCVGETPVYMITVCHTLEDLNAALTDLNGSIADQNRAVGSDSRKFWTQYIKRLKTEIQQKRLYYKNIRTITMEIACDKQDGPTAFCDLLNEFKEYERDSYQKTKTEMRMAREVLYFQADLVCNKREDKISYKYSMQALCEGRSRTYMSPSK